MEGRIDLAHTSYPSWFPQSTSISPDLWKIVRNFLAFFINTTCFWQCTVSLSLHCFHSDNNTATPNVVSQHARDADVIVSSAYIWTLNVRANLYVYRLNKSGPRIEPLLWISMVNMLHCHYKLHMCHVRMETLAYATITNKLCWHVVAQYFTETVLLLVFPFHLPPVCMWMPKLYTHMWLLNMSFQTHGHIYLLLSQPQLCWFQAFHQMI